MKNFLNSCLVYFFTADITPFFAWYLVISVAYASVYGNWIWIFSIPAIIIDIIMQIKITKDNT